MESPQSRFTPSHAKIGWAQVLPKLHYIIALINTKYWVLNSIPAVFDWNQKVYL